MHINCIVFILDYKKAWRICIALGNQYNTIHPKNVLTIPIGATLSLGREIHFSKIHCIVLDKNAMQIQCIYYTKQGNTRDIQIRV
jgi:hypothetical protein